MATNKVGRPKLDSVKLQLAMPRHLGDWVEQMAKNTKYCQNRQAYILGVLEEEMKKQEGREQLELGL